MLQHGSLLLVAAVLQALPMSVGAQATAAAALTPEEREAQDMGLQMAFACSPRRHGLATGSTSTIEREPAPLSGTAVYFSSIEGTFVALEQYNDQLDGHCLVFGWWGDAIEPGTYPITRLSMRAMEEEEMADEHSFFSWGAVRANNGMTLFLVESGSVTIESFSSGSITGRFELTGFAIDANTKGSPMRWAGTFSGVEGEATP
jgi:hypothetical protein